MWQSITHSDMNIESMVYTARALATYRLVWEDYEERLLALHWLSSGHAYLTQQHRWSSEAVWLFHQSDLHLFGSELANFQDAVVRGMLINFIWDMNIKGLEWLAGKLHTPAGARLLEDLGNGNFELLRTFFADERLVQPQDIGRAIVVALSMFGVDVEACMAREFLRFPLGVVECCWLGKRLKKTVKFSKQGASGNTLDWNWIHDESAPGHLLVSELAAFTVNSDMQLGYHDNLPSYYRGQGNGPLWMNRHDRAKLYDEIDRNGGGKWPPRFERRRAKRERKERARSGQKPTRTKMPGTWIP
jgi:hypothetical protein